MTVQPETIAKRIAEKLSVLVDAAKFLSSSDERVVEIEDELEQLQSANPFQAAVYRAYLLHMTGALDAALHELDQTEKGSPIDRLKLLSNYSICSEAQELYSRWGRPSEGSFSSLLVCGISSGAIHRAAAFARDAKKMNLTNLEALPLDAIDMSDRLLTEFGISDQVVGSLMETAGTVLREHGLLFVGSSPEIEAFDLPGELRAVHFTYHLAVPSDRAVRLYMDFIDRLEEKNQVIPRGLHISFAGVAA